MENNKSIYMCGLQLHYKKDPQKFNRKRRRKKCVTFSCVICHMSHVTCHLSVFCRERHLDSKYCIVKNSTMRDTWKQNLQKNIYIYLNRRFFSKSQFCYISNMLFVKKSPVHPVPGATGGDDKHTDISTYRLNWPRGGYFVYLTIPSSLL